MGGAATGDQALSTLAAAPLPTSILQLIEVMLAEPVRDHAYLSTRLGQAVADYLSWKQNEDGAAAITIDGYERVLARMAVMLANHDANAVTADDLRSVRDTYPKGSRYRNTAILKDFWKWMYEEERAETNPMGRVRYPKRERNAIVDLFTEEEQARIVTTQTEIRDRVGVLLLLRAGLRKAELRLLRVKDVNLVERYVLVRRAKGGTFRRVPIRGALVRALDEFMLTEIPGLGRNPGPDDHILYPTRSAGTGRTGSAPDPSRPLSNNPTHNWWYRCLVRAGIVDEGVRKGRKPHSTRHTYATDLGRATNWNMVAVQKNLGHSKIGTTIDTYTQFAFTDQEVAVDALADIDPLEV